MKICQVPTLFTLKILKNDLYFLMILKVEIATVSIGSFL